MGICGCRNVAPPLAFNWPPISQGYVSGMSSIDVLPVGSKGGDDFQSNLTIYHHGSQFDGEVFGRNSAGRSHDLVVHVTRSSHDFDAIAIQRQLQQDQDQLASYSNVHTKIQNPKQPFHARTFLALLTPTKTSSIPTTRPQITTTRSNRFPATRSISTRTTSSGKGIIPTRDY